MENPFATRGFPEFGDPERPQHVGMLSRVESYIGNLLKTRSYDPTIDGEKRRTCVVADSESGEGMGALIEVPDAPNEEFVLTLGDNKMVVAQLPSDARPGDTLRVVMGEDGMVRCVGRIEQASMNLQPIRVIVCTMSCCAVALLAFAIIIPDWVQITTHDGHHVELVGPWGRHLDGFMQPWSQVLQWCQEMRDGKEMPTQLPGDQYSSCQMYKSLAALGRGCVTVLCLCIGLQAWGSKSLLFRHELLGLLATLCSVLCELFIVVSYTQLMKRTIHGRLDVNVKGVGFSTWLVIVSIPFGLVQSMCIFGIWMEGARNRSFVVQGVDILAALKFFAHSDERRARQEGSFAWDERDPGAGCPFVWRTYGFTPAGLFAQYRGHWLGMPYACVVYALSVPFHFIKTFDWNGIRRVWYGPPSEEEAVRKRGVRSTVVVNYMLYRRSNLIMAVVFTLPLLLWTAKCMWEQQGILMDSVQAQEAHVSRTFPEYAERMRHLGQNVSFYNYSMEILAHSVGTITLSSHTIDVWKQIVRLMMLLFAFLFAFAGMLRWNDFNASRYLILLGWLSIVLLPFLTTTIPSTSFISWRYFDQALFRHAQEARVYFEIDDYAMQCFDLDAPATMGTVSRYVDKACGIVRRRVPYLMPEYYEVNVPLYGSMQVPIHKLFGESFSLPPPGTDLKSMHTACNTIQGITKGEGVKRVVDFVHGGCRRFTSFLYHHTSPDHVTSLDDVRDVARAGPGLVDPAHLDAPLLLTLPEDMVAGLAGGSRIAMRPLTPNLVFDALAGLLVAVKYSTSKDADPCGVFAEPSGAPAGPTPLIFVARMQSKCSASRLRRLAADAGAALLLVSDPGGVLGEWPEQALEKSGVKTLAAVPTALLPSKYDGFILFEELTRIGLSARGAAGGPKAVVKVELPKWTPRHARTSHHCRCKARGYESECAVRAPLAAEKGGKPTPAAGTAGQPYPWCETVDNCPVSYDLCSPASSRGVVVQQNPQRKCLPDFPCRLRHETSRHNATGRPRIYNAPGDRDVCAVRFEPGKMYDTIEWMDCVPPAGLIGAVKTFGNESMRAVDGFGSSFGPGIVLAELRGMMLVKDICKYRLHVDALGFEDIAPSARIEVVCSWRTPSRQRTYHVDEEFDFVQHEDLQGRPTKVPEREVDLHIHFWGSAIHKVELQLQCTYESAWRAVPEDQLRYSRESVSAPASSLLVVPGPPYPRPASESSVRSRSEASLPVTPAESLPATPVDDAQAEIEVVTDFSNMADLPVSAEYLNATPAIHSLVAPPSSPRAAKDDETAPRIQWGLLDVSGLHSERQLAAVKRHDEGGRWEPSHEEDGGGFEGNAQQMPGSLCMRFVGLRCGREQRCGAYEVCDLTWKDKEGRQGFCRCQAGTCWDSVRRQCVSEILRAKDFVGSLLQDDKTVDDGIRQSMGILKAFISALVSTTQGLSNLNAIMGHVLALGPGLLISAWTTKLIFARSSVPGYFCYFFPWIYAPMAWGTYSLFYQIFPNGKLLAGLALLAFWPVFLALVTLYYGLHKPMSVPRMMFVVNNLFVIYNGFLFAGYGFLIWFALSFRPSNGIGVIATINKFLDQDWNASKAMLYALSTIKISYIITWMVDSFAVLYFTCCAVTDFFITMICREYEEAWRMQACLDPSAAAEGGATELTQSAGQAASRAPRPRLAWNMTLHNEDDLVVEFEDTLSRQASGKSSALDDGESIPLEPLTGRTLPMEPLEAERSEEEARLSFEEDVLRDWLHLLRGPGFRMASPRPSPKASPAGSPRVQAIISASGTAVV